MKNLFSGLFLIAACCLLAADPAPAELAGSRKTRALEQYVKAMMQNDPALRLPELLKSLELDPDAAMPRQMILEIWKKAPEPQKVQAAEGMLKIAGEHPASMQLNQVAVRMALATSPELGLRAREIVEKAILQGKNRTPRPPYLELLGMHLQNLLNKKEFEKAYTLLNDEISETAEPEGLLYEWSARICRTASRLVPTERRWLGLRESERDMWLGRQQEAIALVRRSDEKLLAMPELEARAFFYILMRSPEDAVRIAETALRKHTGNTDAAFLKVSVLLQVRRYPEALELARQLVNVSPKSPGCLQKLAESALRCGEYDLALTTGRKLRALRPEDESSFLFTVSALVLSNRFDEAQKEIALVKNREFRMELENVLNTRTRNWQPTLARLRKLQANPNYKGGDAVYLTMLIIAEQTRDVKLLEECWQNMEKLGSFEDISNANNVGYVAVVLGHRVEEAGKLIARALKEDPFSGAYLDSMAWYCYTTGDYEKAWEYIQDAMEEIDGSWGVVYDHAGDIALKLGKKAEALNCYRQALGDYLAPELDLQAIQKKIRQLTENQK